MCLSETQCPLLRHHVFLPLTLKDDLDLLPLKNMQLHEIHMHAKYQVAMINISKVMTIFRKLNAKPKRKV